MEPNGSEMRKCSKVQLRRSCHVCCPNHYPVGNKTTCTGILDGIDKTGLRISISADEGQIEYARLPKNYQPRRRHNTKHNSRDRSRNGARTRHQSRRRIVRRPRSVAVWPDPQNITSLYYKVATRRDLIVEYYQKLAVHQTTGKLIHIIIQHT